MLKDFIVPIISILTFIMSILSLSITSLINRKRLILSDLQRFMRFETVKFDPNTDAKEYNVRGIYFNIDISNPSPHDIGLNDFTFHNDRNEILYIETGLQFKKVYLDNLVEASPHMGESITVKANEQVKLSFIINENDYNNLPEQNMKISFSSIYTSWKEVLIHPIKHLKNPASTLKRYTTIQYVGKEINVTRKTIK